MLFQVAFSILLGFTHYPVLSRERANVLPEAVYCCFTRTTLFTTMFTTLIVVCSSKSMYIPSFVMIGCCLSEICDHLCPYHNVLAEALCCFITNTLFTTMSTLIIVVCSHKSMHIYTRFVLIGCYVSL